MQLIPTTPGEETLFRAIDNLFSGQEKTDSDQPTNQPNGGRKMTISEILKNADLEKIKAQTQERLLDLNALMNNPEGGKKAIELLRLAEREAIETLGMSAEKVDVKRDWHAKPWAERLQSLIDMGNDDLSPVIDLMTEARNNPKVKALLEGAMERIVRPAEEVSGYIQLMALLEKLTKDKLVRPGRQPADKEDEENVITVVKPGEITFHYRALGVPIIRAAWHVLKEAEGRAKKKYDESRERDKENRQRTLGLRAKATPGIRLIQILEEGEEGIYCLSLSHGHGALIQFTQQPGSLRVEILENTNDLKWSPMVVSRDGEFRALRNHWPSDEYAALLQKNLQREKEAKTQTQTQRREEEPSPRISEILSLATLPEAGGGVIRLLKGETGVAVAYCQGYRQPNGDKGLIAVALERRHEEGDCLYLKEALSDHPSLDFKSLKGKPLPPIACEEETGRVEYAEHISGFSPAAYRALTVLRVVLQMAVNIERQDQSQS